MKLALLGLVVLAAQLICACQKHESPKPDAQATVAFAASASASASAPRGVSDFPLDPEASPPELVLGPPARSTPRAEREQALRDLLEGRVDALRLPVVATAAGGPQDWNLFERLTTEAPDVPELRGLGSLPPPVKPSAKGRVKHAPVDTRL